MAKPWPSSSNRRYSWSIPFSCIASTICSLSACFTRGSLAPWAMSIGMRIWSTFDSGDRSHRKSASVSGLPTRVWNWAIIGAQYGGIDSISVLMFEGPTMSTAQANTSGVKVAPTSAA